MKRQFVAGNYEVDGSVELGRAAHQPIPEEPSVSRPARNDLERLCSHTVAVVQALHLDGPEAAKSLKKVLRTLSDSCVARIAVIVLKGSEAEGSLKKAASDFAFRKGAPKIKVVAVSRAKLESARRNSCNFELYGVPKAIVDEAARLLSSTKGADKLLFISGGEDKVDVRHIAELHQRFDRAAAEDVTPDVVTSWIAWLRRLPILASAQFLDEIEDGKLCSPYVGSSRSIPQVQAEEMVFGEEMIAEQVAPPEEYAEFARSLKLSALEAVRLAKGESSGHIWPDSPVSPKDRVKGLEGADRLLYDCAKEAVKMLDASLDKDRRLARDVEAADALAFRAKQDFPIFHTPDHEENLVYLDTAATSQRLGSALEAQHRFDAYENANVYRGAYPLSANATASLNDARKKIESFIGAGRRETVLASNATTALNVVVQAWGEHNVGPGDVVAVSIAEHHSNLVSWMMLCERVGAELAYIPVKDDGRIDMAEYRRILNRKPKIVCVAHIGNVLGMLNPVEKMAAMAHEAGARIVVDAAQSMPHVAIDVSSMGADFVAFASHKLYGPLGVGGLWISPEAFDEMDPVLSGGGAISHVGMHTYYLRAGAIQYELGTPPISQAIGFAAAIDWLQEVGMDRISEHDAALTKYMMGAISQMDYLTVWGDHTAKDGQNGLVSFSVHGMQPAEVGVVLGRMGVAVRSGGHCALPLAACLGVVGTTRASFGVYTTSEDVQALVASLLACRKVWRRY